MRKEDVVDAVLEMLRRIGEVAVHPDKLSAIETRSLRSEVDRLSWSSQTLTSRPVNEQIRYVGNVVASM